MKKCSQCGREYDNTMSFCLDDGADKQIESIAVMPFINESGNAEVEYLSDGMTETLIKSLSQLPNLAANREARFFITRARRRRRRKLVKN